MRAGRLVGPAVDRTGEPADAAPPTPEPPTITVAVVARNAAGLLPGCLASARDADARLVIDHASTDATAAQAIAAGAEVVVGEGSLSALRTLALRSAPTAWVLFLDADERLPPGAIGRLRAMLERRPDLAGVEVSIRSHLGSRPLRFGGYAPAWRLRLVRVAATRFAERRVHERPTVEGPVARAAVRLEHHGYRDRAHAVAKLRRYAALAAADLRGAGRRPSWLEGAGRAAWRWWTVAVLRGGLLMGGDGLFLATLQARSVWWRTRWARRGPPADLIAPPCDPHGASPPHGGFAHDPPRLPD